MKSRTFIRSAFSLLLFLAGILFEIAISAGVLWGELEARLYLPSSVSSGLRVRCPHILSFEETGMISTSIINTLNQDIQPMVTAQISRKDGVQQMSQMLALTPHESKTIQWKVDASDRLFGRLILVSILQGKYGDLPAQQGYCGILLLDLFGMNGRTIFLVLCAISFVLLGLGVVTWIPSHLPLNQRDENIVRAFGSLAAFATFGLFCALLRWWGLIIIVDAVTLIVMIVIFTDVLFSPQQRST